MPWTAKSFREKHNKALTPSQADKAAKIANAVLQKTGDEAYAIMTANAKVKGKKHA